MVLVVPIWGPFCWEFRLPFAVRCSRVHAYTKLSWKRLHENHWCCLLYIRRWSVLFFSITHFLCLCLTATSLPQWRRSSWVNEALLFFIWYCKQISQIMLIGLEGSIRSIEFDEYGSILEHLNRMLHMEGKNRVRKERFDDGTELDRGFAKLAISSLKLDVMMLGRDDSWGPCVPWDEAAWKRSFVRFFFFFFAKLGYERFRDLILFIRCCVDYLS